MKINILVFGQLYDITKASQLIIYEVDNTEQLIQKLIEQFPQLKDFKFSIAVNKKIVQGNKILNTEDTVALLPAFSGG